MLAKLLSMLLAIAVTSIAYVPRLPRRAVLQTSAAAAAAATTQPLPALAVAHEHAITGCCCYPPHFPAAWEMASQRDGVRRPIGQRVVDRLRRAALVP